MKNFTLFLLFSFLSQSIFSQQNINGSFTYKGNNRTYILHVPPTYTGAETVPLVLDLHGYNSNAGQQQFYSVFDGIADTANFIIAYPNAVNGVWDTVFFNSTVDDVGFLSALIDTVSAQYNIDSLRIYSTGLSMGGFMTYRLGCELSYRIAAIASVSGPMVPLFFSECASTAPIPVLHIHGTADSTIEYNGGGIWPPVDTVIQYFVNKNNCPASPDTFSFPDVNTSDSCTVTRYYYGLCDDSTEVLFYKVFNGGHTWPGALINITQLGNTNRDINASAEIWNFFTKHTLKGFQMNTYEKMENSGIKVFPNPNGGNFFIQIQDTGYKKQDVEIKIYNILGEKIYQSTVTNPQSTIDLSSHSAGIYFLKIQNGDKITTRKIILSR